MNYRDVFGEILADHHESPRNWGSLPGCTRVEQGYNPLCGDKVAISLLVEKDTVGNERLSRCTFEGEGCSICMASASIMSEMIQGKSLVDVRSLIEGFREKMQGADSVTALPTEDSGEDITALYGVKRFPVRIKCALLPWTTLKKGLEAVHAE
ncbi:MAG: SUF system NifU family Fe-S cluster assembly protein [Bdellovibrionales bacterium]|nr:SUF system NifU family Fe-S cluster assembly protein [Bdellovibrionales bacterium]